MDAVRTGQFPLAKISKITGVSPSGTYGIGDTLKVNVEFKQIDSLINVT